MKAFVAIFSVLAAANAQLVYNNLGAYAPAAAIAAPYAAVAPAALPAPVPSVASSQFHAQDELGGFQFGYANPLSARQESRDAYGVTRGYYTSPDAFGNLQVTHYAADPINGFQVASNNLPVAPAVPVVAPLEAPVFKGVQAPAPVMTLEQVDDTEEVKEAKAAFFKKFDEEKNREKRQAILPAATAPLALNAYAAAPAFTAGLGYAAPAFAGLNYAAPAFAPLGYAAPAPAAIAPAAIAAPIASTYATAGPASAPAIDSVKTTIKLNPGHSTFYRIDPVA